MAKQHGPPTVYQRLKEGLDPARLDARFWRRLPFSPSLALDSFFARSWPSYLLVSLVQLKVLWGIWRFRDFTFGDTTYYFLDAFKWYDRFANNIVWSPLYTTFYGSMLILTEDVYAATTLHRVIIVLVVGLGVVAAMRQILPAGIALLLALWWAVLPVNFETLAEVHLFSVLPILAAFYVAARWDTSIGRGVVLAILLGATVLVRNELSIALLLFVAICLFLEYRETQPGSKDDRGRWTKQVFAYGVPALIALAICLFFYWRSEIKFPQVNEVASSKHTLNMCQVYAFGYAQRHTEWTLSPWLECTGLMTETFGQPYPTLFQMVRNNPAAVAEHFLWNLRLLPNGLQVSLFNAMSGTTNPDYVPVQANSWVALLLTTFVAALLLLAVIKVARQSDYWLAQFDPKKLLVVLLMGALLCVAVATILTQRPRSSYLFGLTFIMMTAIGSAAYVITHRWSATLNRSSVLIAAALLITVPPFYHPTGRPLYENYKRLEPFAELLRQPQTGMLLGDYDVMLGNYLRLSQAEKIYNYSLLVSCCKEESLEQYLAKKRVNVVFIQPRMVSELRSLSGGRQLIEQPETLGWQKLAPKTQADWLLLYRNPSASDLRDRHQSLLGMSCCR